MDVFGGSARRVGLAVAVEVDRGNLEHLAGLDAVGVVELVAVGFEDRASTCSRVPYWALAMCESVSPFCTV